MDDVLPRALLDALAQVGPATVVARVAKRLAAERLIAIAPQTDKELLSRPRIGKPARERALLEHLLAGPADRNERSMTPWHWGSPTNDGECWMPSQRSSAPKACAVSCGPQSVRTVRPPRRRDPE